MKWNDKWLRFYLCLFGCLPLFPSVSSHHMEIQGHRVSVSARICLEVGPFQSIPWDPCIPILSGILLTSVHFWVPNWGSSNRHLGPRGRELAFFTSTQGSPCMYWALFFLFAVAYSSHSCLVQSLRPHDIINLLCFSALFHFFPWKPALQSCQSTFKIVCVCVCVCVVDSTCVIGVTFFTVMNSKFLK